MTARNAQPSIVAGETALETYDRLDMGRSTNVTIAAIIEHYRLLVAESEARSTEDECEALAEALYDLAPATFPVHPLGDGTYDDREALSWSEFAVHDPESAASCRDDAAKLIAAGFRRQRPIADETKRLVYEVKMMLSSVASHGPAALTTTDDPMYTARLLARLRDALQAAERAR